MGVCFLIILNKTNISKDSTLELFIFLFSMPLSLSVILLPFLKLVSFGISFVFPGLPLSPHCSQLLGLIHIWLLTKPSLLWLSVFLVVVDLEPFLSSQLDIFCKCCHSQDGPHLPCISLLSYSFVHVSLYLLII